MPYHSMRYLTLFGAVCLLTLAGCADELTGFDADAPDVVAPVPETPDADLAGIIADVRTQIEHSPKVMNKEALYGRLDAIGQSQAALGDTEAARGLLSLLGLDLDFVLVYVPSVTDPEEESASTFSGHRVKKRSYYRDSISGVSFSISIRGVLSLLNSLLTDPSVLFIQFDDVMSRPLDVSAYQAIGEQQLPWGIVNAEAPLSSAAAGDGSGAVEVDLFVIDSRVSHSDLRVVSETSFLSYRDLPDTEGHGTHVAGTAAALDNGFGVVGTAPGARVHALEVLDAHGAVKLSTLLSAVDHVAAYRRAHPDTPIVVNMSIGGYTGTTSYNALDLAVKASIEQGIVYCVSAGNDGSNAARYSPAHVTEAITVGAFNPDGGFASYSNYGSVVDVLAPGTDVLSTLVGGRYGLLSGTSMATPHVAGAAALYLSMHPGASPEEVRDAIVQSARAGITRVPTGTTRRALRMSGF
ncbi:MAG: S8 family serine peptidase [Rhodothermales bacterium]